MSEWLPFSTHEILNLLSLIKSSVKEQILAPTDVTNRLFLPYLLIAFLIAYWAINKSKNNKNILSTLFPFFFYTHKSTIIDVLIFFINPILLTIGLSTLILTTNVSSDIFLPFLSYLGIGNWLADSPINLVFVYTIFYFIAFDFGQYVAHYLNHKIKLLWEFHKVHHSAEVLTPITAYRFHIIDILFTSSTIGVFTGLAKATSFITTTKELNYIDISGVQIGVILFYLMAYNLRHSHIWLTYPKILSHIFISPAQHQIHHSTLPKHWDKNMGFALAIWDWIFGTLYVASNKEDLDFGINGSEEKEYNKNIIQCYWLPFSKIIKMLINKNNIALILGLFILSSPVKSVYAQNIKQIFIADMTWKEIDLAIKSGQTHIIIPTAGIEQNGLHLPLNKHQSVLKYTTEKIALQHEKMLVAPVINHVPEGDIAKKTGHMYFAGTISLSEQTFVNVLKDTAQSLLAHGFTHIYFIGDSGGNQTGQSIAADNLARKGLSVFHIGDYYANKKQNEWLNSQGYSHDEIGGHAGLRDSSEFMATLQGKQVRHDKLANNSLNNYTNIGSFGDTTKASAKLGKQLLSIKIKLALAQIKKSQLITPTQTGLISNIKKTITTWLDSKN